MRKASVTSLVVGLFAGLVTVTSAGESGHYVPGVEGIKAASIPPPGIYWRMYNAVYSADTLTDGNGAELPVDFDVDVYAHVNRLIWVSPISLLGANYVADVIVPLQNTDLKIGAMDLEDEDFGLGDICVEPFALSWHGPQYDAVVALGAYVPTGDYDPTEPASPGKDFWTGLITAGATVYADEAKTWSLSALTRTEINGAKDETDVDPGEDFVVEWGIAKTFAKAWDVGLAGYAAWQLTDDSGSAVATDQADVHDAVYAVGPEVSVFFPPPVLLGVSLRNLWEFEAEDRSEGQITVLTLTKVF